MSSPAPRADDRQVTLPQVLALMAIWTAVIYGVTAKRPPGGVEQVSLKGRPALTACAKEG